MSESNETKLAGLGPDKLIRLAFEELHQVADDWELLARADDPQDKSLRYRDASELRAIGRLIRLGRPHTAMTRAQALGPEVRDLVPPSAWRAMEARSPLSQGTANPPRRQVNLGALAGRVVAEQFAMWEAVDRDCDLDGSGELGGRIHQAHESDYRRRVVAMLAKEGLTPEAYDQAVTERLGEKHAQRFLSRLGGEEVLP